ncbi:MAG: hypothetical protein HC915_07615 [Anaerolineae bacterium]|nr:hypothetical protein [Anaerolineae bacterium]
MLNYQWGLLQLPAPEALPALEVAAAQRGPQQAGAARLLGILQVGQFTLLDLTLPLVELSEWPHAERLLSQLVEQDGLNSLAYAYRGYVRAQQGDSNARADLETANALEPFNALPYFLLGLVEREAENFGPSLDAFNSAYLLASDNPAIVAELANAYQINGDLPTAAEWFTVATTLAPEDARFVALRAAFYAENAYALGPEGEGIAYLRQVAADFPTNAHILTSWGWAQVQQGELAAAETALTEAWRLAPTDPRVRYFVGVWQERQNQIAAAIEHYSVVVETENPYREAAQTGLERLLGRLN